ncbi:MAG TPA: hypothetical protein PLO65_10820, partial [Caulobacter sp.]|nr:hypothetical protein [Caulobacter sp.]
MTPRRAGRLALSVIATACLASAGPALAQSAEPASVRSLSENAPPPPPKPMEGVEAAEALNADINARNAEAAARDRAAAEDYAR